MNIRRYLLGGVTSAVIAAIFGGIFLPVAAQGGDFSLQVTPSPIVTSVKPGTVTEVELKIRNSGSKAEDLKIEPRSFTIDNTSEEVKLNDTTPPDIADWITFSAPKFKVQPGEWYTQKIIFSLPKDTGFSYSFALIISRQSEPKITEAGRLLKGSVAVFTLVNVDRPGATRKLEAGQFTVSQQIYEYLPAELSVAFKNSGNTIVQPYGNIFIQRGSDDSTPVSTLPVNDKKSYILPDSKRTLKVHWEEGFPVYKTDKNGQQQLVWDFSGAKLSDIRIGRYTAKLVAVYNDGKRDVPIEGEVTFWVLPWKIMLVVLVFVLIQIALWTVLIVWLVRRRRTKRRAGRRA
jgi:hypothetical protein